MLPIEDAHALMYVFMGADILENWPRSFRGIVLMNDGFPDCLFNTTCHRSADVGKCRQMSELHPVSCRVPESAETYRFICARESVTSQLFSLSQSLQDSLYL